MTQYSILQLCAYFEVGSVGYAWRGVAWRGAAAEWQYPHTKADLWLLIAQLYCAVCTKRKPSRLLQLCTMQQLVSLFFTVTQQRSIVATLQCTAPMRRTAHSSQLCAASARSTQARVQILIIKDHRSVYSFFKQQSMTYIHSLFFLLSIDVL